MLTYLSVTYQKAVRQFAEPPFHISLIINDFHLTLLRHYGELQDAGLAGNEGEMRLDDVGAGREGN